MNFEVGRINRIVKDLEKIIITHTVPIINYEVIKENERGNVLQAFEDRPMKFDNWDIDIYYRGKMWEINNVI